MTIGEAINRKEDLRLITGRGQFLDDHKPKDTIHVSYIRSPYAHARVKSIRMKETQSGRALLFTGNEIENVLPMISIWPGSQEHAFPLLAKGEVLFSGQLVAVVASSSKALAEDAAESVEIEYETLPYVIEAEEALKVGAPLVHSDSRSNLIGSWRSHNGDFESAIKSPDVVVVEETFSAQRVTGQAIEPRGALAKYDSREKKLTVYLTSQCPHSDRTLLAECLGMDEDRIEVLVLDVGGGFGINSHLYPEQILVCILSIKTGLPVKWIENRSEHVAGAIHSGDCVQQVAIAASRDGKILGLRDRITQNAGAYLQTRHIVSTFVTAMLVPGPYVIPAYSIELNAVYTNKGPVGTYRAFGMTQATFARERIIEMLARKLGMDSAEVRLRNLIRKEEFPYVNPAGLPYDSGNYHATFSKALELADYYAVKGKKKVTEKDGSRVGIGIAFYIEMGGVGALHSLPTKKRGYVPYEPARARLELDGSVTVFTGASPTGQGIETTLSQVASNELGIPVDRVRVVHGDTDLCPYSGDGTIASRSANMVGNAVLLASSKLKASIEMQANEILALSPGERAILKNEEVISPRDRSKKITLSVIASKAASSHDRSYGFEESVNYQPKTSSGTTAYGVQIAIVEVDMQTGWVRPLKLITVHDCGVMLNPKIVEGMTNGGCAQGLSAALFEEVPYGDDGSFLGTTLSDYLIPTSMEMPQLISDYTITPSPTNALGVKGGGEGGIIGAPAAIANAIYDALFPDSVSLVRVLTKPDSLFAQLKALQVDPVSTTLIKQENILIHK